MNYDFNNDTPIYLQIIDYIKNMIIAGKYLPKQKLPSVRDLSVQFEVNPNTIQKALFELENLGLIKTERTNGKFVTDDESLIKSVRQQTINKFMEDFYSSMKNLGITKNEIIDLIKESK